MTISIRSRFTEDDFTQPTSTSGLIVSFNHFNSTLKVQWWTLTFIKRLITKYSYCFHNDNNYRIIVSTVLTIYPTRSVLMKTYHAHVHWRFHCYSCNLLTENELESIPGPKEQASASKDSLGGASCNWLTRNHTLQLKKKKQCNKLHVKSKHELRKIIVLSRVYSSVKH